MRAFPHERRKEVIRQVSLVFTDNKTKTKGILININSTYWPYLDFNCNLIDQFMLKKKLNYYIHNAFKQVDEQYHFNARFLKKVLNLKGLISSTGSSPGREGWGKGPELVI